MAKQKEKKLLEKKNWSQNFTLVGEAKISDFTFKLDERAKSSDWIYNNINLQIDCGAKSGRVSCELMGGYGAERNNIIYVHGKKDDGSDDFENMYTINWDERFDEDILEDVGEMCFIRVGLEKDVKDQTVVKRFLTAYDAIAYIAEYLEQDMVINVKGNLKYSMYNGKLQCRKEINSMFLSSATPEGYRANFLQTFLVDKDSTGKDKIDTKKKVMYVDAYLLEKFKEFNGWDLTEINKKGIFVPLRKQFEYGLEGKSAEQALLTINNIFKVKKGINQLTFHGDFIESGATVQMTEDDLTEDQKMLVAMGMWKLEDILKTCAANGPKERRMVLDKIQLKPVGDDDNKVYEKQMFTEVFSEEDMILDCLTPKAEEEDDTPPFETESNEEQEDLANLLNSLIG